VIRRMLVVGLSIVVLGLGVACGTAPTPTPAPTQPPVQITVVVTATPPPMTATPLPPPPTQVLPTQVLTPTVASAPATPTRVAAVNTPRPAATRTPTRPAVAPTATSLPIKFAAPKLLNLNYDLDKGVKDERHFPADALVFQWEAITGLGGDECYLVTVSFEPGQRDSFLTGCGNSFTKEVPRNPAEFKLNSPNQLGPNYSSLLPQAGEFWAYWWVTVVKHTGTRPDGKPNTLPISPDSGKHKFLMKGN